MDLGKPLPSIGQANFGSQPYDFLDIDLRHHINQEFWYWIETPIINRVITQEIRDV